MSKPDSGTPPEEGDTGPIPAAAAGAWHREYPDGWEFLLPGGEILRVPYDATGDGPLHEELQRFADAIDLAPRDATLRRPANVIEALARCILEMPSIGKDKEMTEGAKYQYRSIEAVTSHASALFGRYVIVIKPHKIKRQVREITLGNKPWTEDLLKVKYRIYGPGGRKDFIDTAWLHALARDNSDKGTNKAMTQAFKQCLLQLLVVGDNKDDPDSYRAESDGTTREEVPARPPTAEEWSLANGWDSNAQRSDTAKWVRQLLKEAVDAGQIDPGAAGGLWEDYKRPPYESLEGGEGPRSWTDHAAWMQTHLPDTPQPWVAPAAETPQEPTETEPAQPEPAPPAAPPAGQEPASVPESAEPPAATAAPDLMEKLDQSLARAKALAAEPWPPEPEPAPAAPDPEPEAPPEPPAATDVETESGQVDDNGYRSGLDQALDDAGVDAMIAAMRELPIDRIVAELRARGVGVEGKHQPDALRRDLGALILRWHKAPAAEKPTRGRRRS